MLIGTMLMILVLIPDAIIIVRSRIIIRISDLIILPCILGLDLRSILRPYTWWLELLLLLLYHATWWGWEGLIKCVRCVKTV